MIFLVPLSVKAGFLIETVVSNNSLQIFEANLIEGSSINVEILNYAMRTSIF